MLKCRYHIKTVRQTHSCNIFFKMNDFRTHMFSLERQLVPLQDHSPSPQTSLHFLLEGSFSCAETLERLQINVSTNPKMRLVDAQKSPKFGDKVRQRERERRDRVGSLHWSGLPAGGEKMLPLTQSQWRLSAFGLEPLRSQAARTGTVLFRSGCQNKSSRGDSEPNFQNKMSLTHLI